jgi:hypothetical protein
MTTLTEQDMVDIVQSENAALCRVIEQLMAENERLRWEVGETRRSIGAHIVARAHDN